MEITRYSRPSHFNSHNREININSLILIMLDFWWFQIAKSRSFPSEKYPKKCEWIRIIKTTLSTLSHLIVLFYHHFCDSFFDIEITGTINIDAEEVQLVCNLNVEKLYRKNRHRWSVFPTNNLDYNNIKHISQVSYIECK